MTLVRRDEAASVVRRLKREIDGLLQLGGPEPAVSLLDLIDEFWVYTFPVVIGDGRPYLPVRRALRLRPVEHRSLPSGITFHRYGRA